MKINCFSVLTILYTKEFHFDTFIKLFKEISQLKIAYFLYTESSIKVMECDHQRNCVFPIYRISLLYIYGCVVTSMMKCRFHVTIGN